jgi:hypothetical protein
MDNEMDNKMDNEVIIKVMTEEEEMQKVTNDERLWNQLRNCRAMSVPDGIDQTARGEFVTLGVEGGGMCMWYYYHSLEGHHMLIFKSHYKNDNHYSGRMISSVPKSFGMEQYP